MKLREVVGTAIGGGGGRALGVVWGWASISESESFSRPPQVCLHAPWSSGAHSPGGAGRIGVGDHVNGFELMGSGELPWSCGLPDIFLARKWVFGIVTKYF